jgi:hypothetical protein
MIKKKRTRKVYSDSFGMAKAIAKRSDGSVRARRPSLYQIHFSVPK